MVGLYSGDHLTILYTKRTMLVGAFLRRYFNDNLGGLSFHVEKSNSLALSHLDKKWSGGAPRVESSICICSSSVLEGKSGVPV